MEEQSINEEKVGFSRNKILLKIKNQCKLLRVFFVMKERFERKFTNTYLIY